MKVIIETGDPTYLILRSQELIAEARHCDSLSANSDNEAVKQAHVSRADECLKNAVSLLAVARLKRAERK